MLGPALPAGARWSPSLTVNLGKCAVTIIRVVCQNCRIPCIRGRRLRGLTAGPDST